MSDNFVFQSQKLSQKFNNIDIMCIHMVISSYGNNYDVKFSLSFHCFFSGLKNSYRSIMMRQSAGLTLVELMLAIAILGVIAAIAYPTYQGYKDRANVAAAVTDIIGLSMVISAYQTDNYSLPNSLSDVGAGNKLDPWGHPYQYLNISSVTGKGKVRKDKSLNPINSDYDLYSMGKDGQSTTALTAKNSQDDVIRARDGKFIGLASDF